MSRCLTRTAGLAFNSAVARGFVRKGQTFTDPGAQGIHRRHRAPSTWMPILERRSGRDFKKCHVFMGRERSTRICDAVDGRRGFSLEKFNIFGESEVDGSSRTLVESYNRLGFVINGTQISGAVILLPETVLHWNVTEIKDVTWDSLGILRILRDCPEICIIGTGRRLQRLAEPVSRQMKQLGIHVELMDSINASATFNVLNEEGRKVVCALLPLDQLDDIDLSAKPKEEEKEDILKDMPRPKMRMPPRQPPDGGR